MHPPHQQGSGGMASGGTYTADSSSAHGGLLLPIVVEHAGGPGAEANAARNMEGAEADSGSAYQLHQLASSAPVDPLLPLSFCCSEHSSSNTSQGSSCTASGPRCTSYIVDLRFRDQFAIPVTTRRYTMLMALVPAVYVGREDRIAMVVEVLCYEMAKAFKTAGLVLPPWRSTQSMMSKWQPRRGKCVEVPLPLPAPLPSSAAAGAEPGGSSGPGSAPEARLLELQSEGSTRSAGPQGCGVCAGNKSAVGSAGDSAPSSAACDGSLSSGAPANAPAADNWESGVHSRTADGSAVAASGHGCKAPDANVFTSSRHACAAAGSPAERPRAACDALRRRDAQQITDQKHDHAPVWRQGASDVPRATAADDTGGGGGGRRHSLRWTARTAPGGSSSSCYSDAGVDATATAQAGPAALAHHCAQSPVPSMPPSTPAAQLPPPCHGTAPSESAAQVTRTAQGTRQSPPPPSGSFQQPQATMPPPLQQQLAAGVVNPPAAAGRAAACDGTPYSVPSSTASCPPYSRSVRR